MGESGNQTTGAAGRWELSREALDSLLLALDADREAAGRRYERMRRKLIDLFAWRGVETPEELADETLNRLARRLQQGEAVERIESYALGIARLLLKEDARRRELRSTALREIQVLGRENAHATGIDTLERCLAALPESSRLLISRYYSEDRAALAADLGVSLLALRTRALRIRRKLYDSVMACNEK